LVALLTPVYFRWTIPLSTAADNTFKYRCRYSKGLYEFALRGHTDINVSRICNNFFGAFKVKVGKNTSPLFQAKILLQPDKSVDIQ
jgi:hypothetical protein